MIIRSITPADQEQLLLLEEELHDNEGKEHRATLEEALGSKGSHFFACRAGGGCCGLLVGDRRPAFKGNLIVLRLAVRPAFQGQGYGSIFNRCFKGSSCSKGKGSHLDRLLRRLTILFFPARISR